MQIYLQYFSPHLKYIHFQSPNSATIINQHSNENNTHSPEQIKITNILVLNGAERRLINSPKANLEYLTDLSSPEKIALWQNLLVSILSKEVWLNALHQTIKPLGHCSLFVWCLLTDNLLPQLSKILWNCGK